MPFRDDLLFDSKRFKLGVNTLYIAGMITIGDSEYARRIGYFYFKEKDHFIIDQKYQVVESESGSNLLQGFMCFAGKRDIEK